MIRIKVTKSQSSGSNSTVFEHKIKEAKPVVVPDRATHSPMPNLDASMPVTATLDALPGPPAPVLVCTLDGVVGVAILICVAQGRMNCA